jgi:hypothetical protein
MDHSRKPIDAADYQIMWLGLTRRLKFKGTEQSGGGAGGVTGARPSLTKGEKTRRSQMTPKEKVAYIKERGSKAYETLPWLKEIKVSQENTRIYCRTKIEPDFSTGDTITLTGQKGFDTCSSAEHETEAIAVPRLVTLCSSLYNAKRRP